MPLKGVDPINQPSGHLQRSSRLCKWRWWCNRFMRTQALVAGKREECYKEKPDNLNIMWGGYQMDDVVNANIVWFNGWYSTVEGIDIEYVGDDSCERILTVLLMKPAGAAEQRMWGMWKLIDKVMREWGKVLACKLLEWSMSHTPTKKSSASLSMSMIQHSVCSQDAGTSPSPSYWPPAAETCSVLQYSRTC